MADEIKTPPNPADNNKKVADTLLQQGEVSPHANDIDVRHAAGSADAERTYSYNFAGYTVSKAEAAIAAVKAGTASSVAASAAYSAHAASIRAYDLAIEAMQRASDDDQDMDPSYLNAAIEGAIEAMRHTAAGRAQAQKALSAPTRSV